MDPRAAGAVAVRRRAELAAEAGYYDQAHLARDVRGFTGLAPRAWLAQHHLLDDG